MKWKGQNEATSDQIVEKLIAADLDPDEVKKALIQDQDKGETKAVNLER